MKKLLNSIQQYKSFRDQGFRNPNLVSIFFALCIAFIVLFRKHAGYIYILVGILLMFFCLFRVVEGILAFRSGYWRERAQSTGRLLSEYKGNKAKVAAVMYILFNLFLMVAALYLFAYSGVNALLPNL